MYGTVRPQIRDPWAGYENGRDPTLLNRGNWKRLLHTHRSQVLAILRGDPDVPPIAPLLMLRVADSRTMYAACKCILARGPTAPGPGGIRLEEFGDSAIWGLCRALAQAIRDGDYSPGRERRIKIPKETKPGEFRQIAVQDVEDRIVASATQMVLEP